MKQTIVIADIFGRTKALDEFCNQLNTPTNIIEPYQGEFCQFENEAVAYQCFMSDVGLESYQQIIANTLIQLNQETRIIAFSVGASALWQLSELVYNPLIDHAYCFYGSQIRNAISIVPKFPITLVFPKHEPHFLIDELIAKLKSYQKQTKSPIEIEQANYLHGFINKCSINFDPAGYQEIINRLNR